MRVAAIHNTVVMVSNHMITKIRNSAQATLRPPIASPDWENAMRNRIMIFREWAQDNDHHHKQSLHRSASRIGIRFAYAMKANGLAGPIKDGGNSPLAFVINDVSIFPRHRCNAP